MRPKETWRAELAGGGTLGMERFFSVKGNVNSAAKAGSLGKMCLAHPLPSLFIILLSYFST